MPQPTLRRMLLTAFGVAALIYVALVALLAAGQRYLIYLPSRASETALLRLAPSVNLEPWRDDAGVIIGWRRAPRPGGPAANRLVVFHGNAGHALYRAHFPDGFGALDGGRLWEVILLEYPGFGARPGAAGERAFREAGAAALAQLRREDPRPVFLLGESLGSGLACALAGAEPESVAGVALLTPYASLVETAGHHYPWVPVGWILRDRWDNVAAIASYRGPVATVLAGRDEVVPTAHGRRLFDAVPGPKRLWLVPRATHNGLDFSASAPWWREVSDFLLQPRS